jgi:hypothetical protein
MIGRHFVPAAVNLYEVRKKDHPAYAFFAGLQKQKDNYQGIWIATADGKLLATYMEWESKQFDWTERLIETLQGTLRSFGPVTERHAKVVDPNPFRGSGVKSDGSVHLAGTSRGVLNGGKILTAPQIDTIALTERQFAGFRPPRAQAGIEFDVPAGTTCRLSRLMTNGSGQNYFPEPDDVTSARLKGQVAEVNGDRSIVVYVGTMTASHKDRFDKGGRMAHGRSQILGYGVYDAREERMLSLLLLLDSSYRGFPPSDQPQSIAGVAEWRGR